MRKSLGILLCSIILILIFSGCSKTAATSGSGKVTFDDYVKAFTDAGVQVDKEQKPMFQLIGAKDGIIFYMDGNPVKIYEYESKKALQDAKSKNSIVEGMVTNEKYALETRYDKAKEVFQRVGGA